MKHAKLHIVTAISNPIRWESRIRLAKRAIEHWLSEPQVHVTLVECAMGARDFELDGLASDRITHVPVRATTMVWSKENLINIGIAHLPADAEYVGTFDCDITYRKPGWAGEILHALQLYPVIEAWKTCYDLGPNDEHIAAHHSFASIYHSGRSPVIPRFDPRTRHITNSPYPYPHPGYCWAWILAILSRIGGLFELGACGASDHHMALSMIGKVDASVPKGINGQYLKFLKAWESQALSQVNKKLGFIHQTIEHPFHGRKADRKYNFRWFMLSDHNFDPITDLKKNRWGVLEWAGNKPELEREWDNYLRDRNEDINIT